MPADGTGAASYESGDFDTSPFLGSPGASRRPPLPMYLWYRQQSTMVQREFIAQLTSLSCWLHRRFENKDTLPFIATKSSSASSIRSRSRSLWEK